MHTSAVHMSFSTTGSQISLLPTCTHIGALLLVLVKYDPSLQLQYTRSCLMMMTHITATYGEWPTILPGEESGNRSIQIICWFCRESPVWGILGWPKHGHSVTLGRLLEK